MLVFAFKGDGGRTWPFVATSPDDFGAQAARAYRAMRPRGPVRLNALALAPGAASPVLTYEALGGGLMPTAELAEERLARRALDYWSEALRLLAGA